MLNISSDVIRGYNDTIILYLLLDKPSYGYEISKQIKQISEEKYVIKETTLYSAFTALRKRLYHIILFERQCKRQKADLLSDYQFRQRILQDEMRGMEADT